MFAKNNKSNFKTYKINMKTTSKNSKLVLNKSTLVLLEKNEIKGGVVKTKECPDNGWSYYC
jgi:hypothetical protein